MTKEILKWIESAFASLPNVTSFGWEHDGTNINGLFNKTAEGHEWSVEEYKEIDRLNREWAMLPKEELFPAVLPEGIEYPAHVEIGRDSLFQLKPKEWPRPPTRHDLIHEEGLRAMKARFPKRSPPQ